VPNDFVEHVVCGSTTLAIIVSHLFRERGVHFVTPGDLSQQVAYIRHPQGTVIKPHLHNRLSREVHYTQEVLLVRKGKLRADFYDTNKCYLESRILEAGDVILLIEGGHGFEALEELEMIEVKQGPYLGEHDKTCFASSRVKASTK
jgi:mannose-6-phosphate isomerase-like protein (cupin superfamily)